MWLFWQVLMGVRLSGWLQNETCNVFLIEFMLRNKCPIASVHTRLFWRRFRGALTHYNTGRSTASNVAARVRCQGSKSFKLLWN